VPAVIVVIVVVFVVPVAFVHLPALLVVVVVRVAPVGPGIGWVNPDARHPDVAASTIAPVAFRPDIAFARHGGTHFIAQRRRCATDIDMNLGNGGSGEGSKSYSPGEQGQFPIPAVSQKGSPFYGSVHRMQVRDRHRFIFLATNLG